MTPSLCYLYQYVFYVFYLQALPDEHAGALNPRHLAGAGGDLVPTYTSRKHVLDSETHRQYLQTGFVIIIT
jgi:hypothetical protein